MKAPCGVMLTARRQDYFRQCSYIGLLRGGYQAVFSIMIEESLRLVRRFGIRLGTNRLGSRNSLLSVFPG